MSCFEPCPACHRHVVTDETVCPFCAAPLPACLRKAERAPLRGRLSRAALLAAGATATLISASSCSSAYGLAAAGPLDAGSMSDAADTEDGAGGGGGASGTGGTGGASR